MMHSEQYKTIVGTKYLLIAHAPDGSWISDYTIHPNLMGGGNAVWARAHWFIAGTNY